MNVTNDFGIELNQQLDLIQFMNYQCRFQKYILFFFLAKIALTCLAWFVYSFHSRIKLKILLKKLLYGGVH